MPGYIASAVEREQLLGEVTARNRVLETIRDVLETLAGPVPLAHGPAVRAARALPRPPGRARGGSVTEPASPARREELACRRRRGEGAVVPLAVEAADAAARCAPADAATAGRRASSTATASACMAVSFLGAGRRRHAARPMACASDPARRDGADGGCGELAAPGARAPGVRASARGGERAAPLARAPARLPVAPQSRAANAADRDRRLRLEPDGARRDLGRRVARSASSAGSARSRHASTGSSTTCSTSRRSSPRRCGCSPTGASSRRCIDAAVACVTPSRAAAWTSVPARPAGDLGRPRPSRAGLRQPARERAAPQPRGHARLGQGTGDEEGGVRRHA